MAVLLIATDRADSIPADTTPLGASLDAAATIVRWTFDADDPAVTATVMIDVDTALRPGALDLIGETLDHHLDVEILTADGLVDDELRLRGAWAPTRIAHDPSELDLVVTRGHAADGSLDARVEALFAVDPASIGQLPAVLTEHSGPPPLGLATMERAADLLARRRTRPTVGAVSVVIPTAGFLSPDGRPLVVAAIDAARRGGITDLEILLVVGDEYVGDPESLLADDVRLVHRPPGSWNFSAAVNLGLLAAEHDHVLVLNDDIEAIGDGWLASMAAHLRDPDVGAVGALLLFPDGTIQHAGMVVDDAVPLHCFAGSTPESVAGLGPREVAAVTGACLLGRRADLLAVGGLNEALPFNFNDVDLCFKLLRGGRRVVLDTAARLIHHEGASREPVTHGWEWDRFIHRWGQVVDPWYHPAFVRPDDPDDRRRNADHLLPDTVPVPGELRTPAIRSVVHEARLRGHGGGDLPE